MRPREATSRGAQSILTTILTTIIITIIITMIITARR